MINYKRLAFVFILISFLLVVTDTTSERQARKALLSFINVVVDEGTEVTETAPGNILDSLEAGRNNFFNFFNKYEQQFESKSENAKSYQSIIFTIISYIAAFFRLICTYVITFYPFIIYLLYLFFTSRFFRRDEFSDFNTY